MFLFSYGLPAVSANTCDGWWDKIGFTSTIQLVVIMACITAIVWLFLKYSKDYKREDTTTNILYISGYAVLIIIELVVFICLNNDKSTDIITTISFGATLSSLIMSVVAIIFTIVSGRDGRKQLGRIDQATTTLEQTAEGLGAFKTTADDINTRIKQLHEKIDDLIGFTQTKFDHLEEMQGQAIQEAKSLQSAKDTNIADNSDLFSKELKNDFLSTMSYLGDLALLACYYAWRNDKSFSLKELNEKFSSDYSEYMQGYLIACGQIEIIQVSIDNFKVSISSLYDDIFKQLESFTKSFIQSKDDDMKKFSLELLNNLLKFFDKPSITLEELEKKGLPN